MSVTIDVRPEVAAFAVLMEAKLRENDHKGGWASCDVDWLYTRLEEESRELYACKLELARLGENYGTVDVRRERVTIGREAADVANFAMMLADVCGALALTPPPPLPGPPGSPESESALTEGTGKPSPSPPGADEGPRVPPVDGRTRSWPEVRTDGTPSLCLHCGEQPPCDNGNRLTWCDECIEAPLEVASFEDWKADDIAWADHCRAVRRGASPDTGER